MKEKLFWGVCDDLLKARPVRVDKESTFDGNYRGQRDPYYYAYHFTLLWLESNQTRKKIAKYGEKNVIYFFFSARSGFVDITGSSLPQIPNKML